MTKKETTIPTTQHKQLLQKVKTIIAHHRELTKAKGELFNIYDILSLTTNEVRTHSAFLAELLNPNGTHLLGTTFLQAFIDILPKDIFENYLDVENTTVIVEYHIGTIDTKNKTGGRIDILLKDAKGNSISIENKIDAGDQKNQVIRYYNYNTQKNKVIYLSKYGDEPNKESKGKLIMNKDFYVIGYQQEIIQWLETCQALAYDQPIVRESIKQYKILIQKITHTLGNQQDKELKVAIVEHLEEASQIATTYQQVIRKIKNDFRVKVYELLVPKFPNYSLKRPKDINQTYASIWFNEPTCAKNATWFAVESFSGYGNKNGILYVGIYSDNPNFKREETFNRLNKWWLHYKALTYNDEELNLSDLALLKTLSNRSNMEAIANSVVEQIIEFVKAHEKYLLV
ncbi:PDDEXK-like family protein [Kordia zhangzhouensis]|uniref:PDDEXK-like family protein n=1 Tax=Kordia zhangzhouensis TaxID=1620405 RepID=UPI000699E827|nr:PD-(D/E)XK nuclease family protein [Kordia zhangzhouensis]